MSDVSANMSVSPVRNVQVGGVWSVAELVRYKLHLDLVIDIVDISRYLYPRTWWVWPPAGCSWSRT